MQNEDEIWFSSCIHRSSFIALSMEIKKGIGVSPGVVIGTAVVLVADELVLPRCTVAAAGSAGEVDRLIKAVADSSAELTDGRDEVVSKFGKEIGGILRFHLPLLKDKTLLKQI